MSEAMVGLSEQEFEVIATRNQCCLFVSNVMNNAYDSVIESVIREDVPRLLAEVRSLRKLAALMARPLVRAALRNGARDDDLVDLGDSAVRLERLRELLEPAAQRD